MDVSVAHLFRGEAVWCELAPRFEFESDGLRSEDLSYIGGREAISNRDTKLLETGVTSTK